MTTPPQLAPELASQPVDPNETDWREVRDLGLELAPADADADDELAAG